MFKIAKGTKGFSLVEVMIVIVILGILVSIGAQNFYSATERAKIANVKSNMHAFQHYVEIYAIDWSFYPETASILKKEAVTHGYWKVIINPYTNNIDPADTTLNTVSVNGAVDPVNFPTGNIGFKGNMTGYSIYGAGKVSGRALIYEGKVFQLTNS